MVDRKMRCISKLNDVYCCFSNEIRLFSCCFLRKNDIKTNIIAIKLHKYLFADAEDATH